MAIIRLLDQATVNKIAAGEVVERPASVVKEMVENAIDAGATEVTVEIADGGISLIRITDNGSGIEADQVRTAFLRHATSKIRKVEDLQETMSLGFRGEALASIAAVARVEMTTRTSSQDTGLHYVIEGGVEYASSEVACAKGTTIKVENLFFNTPARKKFLKKPASEAAAITDLMQKMILGHPEVSFRYLNGKKDPTLFSAGRGSLKNSIFGVYGKEVLDKMIPVEAEVPLSDTEKMKVRGYISRPQSMRANRSYETMFINGRYVRSNLLERALDEAYKDYVVPGTFPIAVLHLEMDPSCLDVNVHPTKMEVRFMEEARTRQGFYEAIFQALNQENLVARVGSFYRQTEDIRIHGSQPGKDALGTNESIGRDREERIDRFVPAKKPYSPWKKEETPVKPVYLSGGNASFEKSASMMEESKAVVPSEEKITTEKVEVDPSVKAPAGAIRSKDLSFEWPGNKKEIHKEEIGTPILEEEIRESEETSPAKLKAVKWDEVEEEKKPAIVAEAPEEYKPNTEALNGVSLYQETPVIAVPYQGEQVETILEEVVKEEKGKPSATLRLIGQVFRTYWLAEDNDIFYIVDQHAAHERVLYDKYRALLQQGNIDTQSLLEPVVCTVDPKAVASLDEYMPVLTKLGYEVEAFGEDAVIVRGVPYLFRGPLAPEDMALVIDMCYNGQVDTARDLLIDRIATMSCKSAVKGNDAMSFEEAKSLLDQLFISANPYNCPHGRPTIISMTKYEMEKRFKRV